MVIDFSKEKKAVIKYIGWGLLYMGKPFTMLWATGSGSGTVMCWIGVTSNART